jgi:very-short-patch-repair endonuclease
VAHGGRHSRDTDRDKLNVAAVEGWRVLRFSPQQLKRDPLACVVQVLAALEYK